ncbi:MAG: hypothetical protein R3B07_31685 [Polyangiaceae bacterium]
MFTRFGALAWLGVARKRRGARSLALGLGLLSLVACSSGGDVSLGKDQSGAGRGAACGDTQCAVGEVCCNASCGICAKPDEGCILLACDPGGGTDPGTPGDPGTPDDPPGQPCGDTVCGQGQECCNASCGTCVEAGGACDQRACEPAAPPGEQCGNNWCGEGTWCCNATCGMCVAEGEGCIEPDCGRDVCDAQEAQAAGNCEMFLGVRWSGGGCELLSGCGCAGGDCGGLYPSLEVCESAHLNCASK